MSDIMSSEANLVILHMAREISQMKYCYRSVMNGCYEVATTMKNFDIPPEGRTFCVDEVMKLLKNLE